MTNVLFNIAVLRRMVSQLRETIVSIETVRLPTLTDAVRMKMLRDAHAQLVAMEWALESVSDLHSVPMDRVQ